MRQPSDSYTCRKIGRRTLIAGALACVTAGRSRATDSTVNLVVPFPAGGPVDALGRILARSLGTHMRQTLIVTNVAGAAGRRGAAQVANAVPDGHTLLLGTSATHAIAASLFPKLAYRPEQAFSTAGSICTSRLLLVARPSLRIQSVADLVVAARTAATPFTYGSWGIGSGGHLLAEAVRQEMRISLLHVPYQGTGPMMQGLLGGEIDLAVSDMGGGLALARDGKVVPLAITGTSRLSELPQVATLAESGIASLPPSWCALFAPARTRESEMERLESALQATLGDWSVRQALKALAYEPESLGRGPFLRQWLGDIVAWRRIVADSGITLE